MRIKPENLSPEKRAAVQDFKTNITGVFNNLYEDSWDEERWDRAVGKLFSLHPFFGAILIDVRALCAQLLDLTVGSFNAVMWMPYRPV